EAAAARAEAWRSLLRCPLIRQRKSSADWATFILSANPEEERAMSIAAQPAIAVALDPLEPQRCEVTAQALLLSDLSEPRGTGSRTTRPNSENRHWPRQRRKRR